MHGAGRLPHALGLGAAVKWPSTNSLGLAACSHLPAHCACKLRKAKHAQAGSCCSCCTAVHWHCSPVHTGTRPGALGLLCHPEAAPWAGVSQMVYVGDVNPRFASGRAFACAVSLHAGRHARSFKPEQNVPGRAARSLQAYEYRRVAPHIANCPAPCRARNECETCVETRRWGAGLTC